MSRAKLNRIFELNTVPDHGVYCVYKLINNKDEIIYIGQTSSLETRLYGHLIDKKDFSFFEYILCNKDEATKLESAEIIKHNPKLNKSLPVTPEHKTIDQARKMINDSIRDAVKRDIDKLVNSIDIVFHRPPTKNMKFTYVKTSDIEVMIKNIANMGYQLKAEVK